VTASDRWYLLRFLALFGEGPWVDRGVPQEGFAAARSDKAFPSKLVGHALRIPLDVRGAAGEPRGSDLILLVTFWSGGGDGTPSAPVLAPDFKLAAETLAGLKERCRETLKAFNEIASEVQRPR
jgi:hypothetical protein